MTQRYAHLRDEALKRASGVAGDLAGKMAKVGTKVQTKRGHKQRFGSTDPVSGAVRGWAGVDSPGGHVKKSFSIRCMPCCGRMDRKMDRMMDMWWTRRVKGLGCITDC
jgi:hypothetical protein